MRESDLIQPEVAEFQGFYGPFTVTEKLLQKIWLRGDFNSAEMCDLEGEPVEVIFPGKWNLLEGPDFKDARLRVGGREVTGDVELHFRVGDWAKHRHHLDRNYDRVVLHVVLFRPGPDEAAAVTVSGRRLRAISLLELLHHDLEEYAAEDAIEATLIRNHWKAAEELLGLPLEDRRSLLARQARLRWEQKVRYAKLRVDKLGWTEACHQTALEILGYRRNRGAMLTLATRYPLDRWRLDAPGEEELLAAAHWIVRGARPVNHPRQRLRQYLQMMEACPEWPERLQDLAEGLEIVEEGERFGSGSFRAERKLKALRGDWAEQITGGFIGGTRLDTLFCDGFLPLAATEGRDLFAYWFHWYAGDFPDGVVRVLRTADITDRREFVTSNGLCQGVLWGEMKRNAEMLKS